MDYNRPLNESGDNPKVHIALLMVPGKHPIWEKHSKSPLLINPGGPGGPGTIAAMGFGPYIQKVVGEDQDIIGFVSINFSENYSSLLACLKSASLQRTLE